MSDAKKANLVEIVAKASQEEAKARELRIQAEKAEREAKERARKALEAVIAEPREQLAELREQLGKVEAERKAAIEAVEAKYRPRIDGIVQEGEDIIAAVAEETGLTPEVLATVGVAIRRPKAKRRGGGGRKTVRVGELGEFQPVTVTAPHRRSDGLGNPCTVVLEGVADSSAPQGYVVRGKRIDNGDPGSYTHESVHEDDRGLHNNLSRVTTTPGWIETRDAAVAILAATGRLGEYPDLRPASDPSEVFVNGEPLTNYLQ